MVRPRYEWLYVAAFVRPETGETSFWLVPEVSPEAFRLLVHSFAQEQSVGKRKRIRLVLDNAGWHVDETTPPEGLTLDFLPPMRTGAARARHSYSPELMPAERLWTLLDDPLVNRSWSTAATRRSTRSTPCWASAASSSARGPSLFAHTRSSIGGHGPGPMIITGYTSFV